MPEHTRIPVEVAALRLTREDAEKLWFNRATADFSALPGPGGREGPYLASEAATRPFEGEVRREPGVYLHWSLPPDCTRGELDEQGEVTFKNAPNRWLVTRTAEQYGQLVEGLKRQWKIESDALSWERPESGSATVPMPPPQGNEPERTFAFLGSVRPYQDGEPLEERRDDTPRFPNLTTLGPGQVEFAAYSPNCHGVFAVFDPEGLEAVAGAESTRYNYTVVGWHGDQEPDDADEASFTLYHGAIRGVPLAGDEACCKVPETGRMHVAFGNNAAEALSALVAGLARGAVNEAPEFDIEDLLNAAQLDLLSTENTNLINLQRLREEVHRAAFAAYEAPSLWILKPAGNDNPERPPIEPEWLRELAAINEIQAEHDTLGTQLAQRREQLFSDWTRYLRALRGRMENPPEPDGILDLMTDEAEQLEKDTAEHSDREIRRRLEALTAQIQPHYRLDRGAGSRYWNARDPVVLIAWDHARFSDRFKGAGETTASQIVSGPAREAAVVALAAESPATACRQWSDPWEPLRLEWQASHRSLHRLEGLESRYPLDWLSSSFDWRGPELEANGDRPESSDDYSGATVVSPEAMSTLGQHLDKLIRLLSPERFAPIIKRLKQVRERLRDVPVLSQRLEGFHEALVMRQQTFQVDVRDPFGFRNTWEQISKAIDKANTHDALPNSRFGPLRAGLLDIPKLRLSDAHGKIANIDMVGDADVSLYTARSLAPPQAWRANLGRARFYAAPRIAQAARLLGGWRGGIAGWVLANRLDGSLMVYAGDGVAIGALTLLEDRSRVVWRNAPGTDLRRDIEEALRGCDPRFRSVILRLYRGDGNHESAMMLAFLATVDAATRKMDPAYHTVHADEAVMVGRPLVFAGTRLQMELHGFPNLNQSWDALKQAIESHQEGEGALPYLSRPYHEFDKTKVPVRIGQLEDGGDGLVGHFPSPRAEVFYSEFAPPGRHPAVLRPEMGTVQLDLVPGSAPFESLLLLDPRYPVSINIGVLPGKKLRIARGDYEAALGRMQITFLAAPMLTPADPLSLVLPNTRRGSWSFMELENSQWKETREFEDNREGIASPTDEELRDTDPLSLREGWLRFRRPENG